ncbi:hypothetical protein GCM10010387_04500 [Streptomyces inusitatus]|uniref:N-acetyltransferase domain-containing protein n=1 Tax=Streptomyces inusitatus TaxID=68221 RepID=A0A918PNT6_9ACTN|nr:GNAT family N-acetyltransferase [Streptomyces inusitatus]GGZ15291.1 hypothetical protein GCM10010387_04500 [Streptomyces inusitatus]
MDDITTPRLILHPLTRAEAERLAAGAPGPGEEWTDGYPDEGDRAGARRFLKVWAEEGDPRPFGAYEIRRRADGRAIGGVGFHRPPDGRGSVTIGYGLIPSARGEGYASEAVRALLELARGLGVVRVEADTDLDNIGSRRVLEAVGMRQVAEDGELRFYRIERLS